MPISQFSDVDNTDPQRLAASLGRREHAHQYEPYRRHITNTIRGITVPGIVVDVGSGNGQAVARITPHRTAIGVEPSRHLTRAALAHNRPVIQGTGTSLPFPDQSVAAVLLERVLQHVATSEAVLDECARIVVPGGVIVVADPDHPTTRIRVPALGDLADRVSAWRTEHGVANPYTNARVHEWADRHHHRHATTVFPTGGGHYPNVRPLTNFPEWAGLAHQDGHPISDTEVREWEAFFTRAETGDPNAEFQLRWDIHVTTISIG